MLGLPLGESMRCRLFAGFRVCFASRSKPMVEHRTREIRVALHAGSYGLLEITRQCHFRSSLSSATLPASRLVLAFRLARLILGEQRSGTDNVPLLPFLCAAAQEQDEVVGIEPSLTGVLYDPHSRLDSNI